MVLSIKKAIMKAKFWRWVCTNIETRDRATTTAEKNEQRWQHYKRDQASTPPHKI